MMWIIWIPVVVILILLLVRYLDNTGLNRSKFPGRESPLDILKRRYASGELSTEQYEERKKKLEEQ